MYNEITPMEQGEYLNQTLTDDQWSVLTVDSHVIKTKTLPEIYSS